MYYLTKPAMIILLTAIFFSACSEEYVATTTPPDQSSVEQNTDVIDTVSSETEKAAEAAKPAQEKLDADAAAQAAAKKVIREAQEAQATEEARKLAATRAAFDQKRREAEAAVVNAQGIADAQLAAQTATKALAEAEAANEAARVAAAAEQTAIQQAEQTAREEAAAEAQAYAMRDRVIAQGTFTKKKKTINGGWSIVMKDGHRFLRFDDAFKTKWANDLQVFLSPQAIGSATGKNAGQNVYRLAPLQARKGAQEYAIPDEVDLDIYQSILIHCEEYKLLWGGTALH